MPSPETFAVIFTSQRTNQGQEEYQAMATRMEDLARQQEGFLGIDSVRDAQGFGITVSYWSSLSAITNWKANADHLAAQKRGRAEWYKSFKLRICKVEREYTVERE